APFSNSSALDRMLRARSSAWLTSRPSTSDIVFSFAQISFSDLVGTTFFALGRHRQVLRAVLVLVLGSGLAGGVAASGPEQPGPGRGRGGGPRGCSCGGWGRWVGAPRWGGRRPRRLGGAPPWCGGWVSLRSRRSDRRLRSFHHRCRRRSGRRRCRRR